MDYLCAKFDDFSIRVFYLADRQTESHTDSITKADKRYTHETTVGVSENCTA